IPEAGYVVLKIYSILGQKIRVLTEAYYEAGYHSLRWDARDNAGNPVPSGVYLYQLRAGEFSQVRKMSLMR
ncbi:T9SS type A sorting domain-containing protein, partial [candidate division KSB1 bacterium]|nr:T9SS type A sorting domain-containing protein [candidate division KSB1 bacterium]